MRWEPGIVVPLLISLAWYIAGAMRRGNIQLLRWRHAAFLLGWATLFFALTSPIHELGEQLFSAHMLQHEIMILVSAPLIAASHSGATLLWAFAPRQRFEVGTWVHRVEMWAPLLLLTSPAAAWTSEACALWGWHLPYLYQATLYSDWVHAAQHLTFLVTAVVFWSALFGVGRPAFSYGAGTFYVFATAVHCSALGALLTFSTVLWYPAYPDNDAVGPDSTARSATWRSHHVGAFSDCLYCRRTGVVCPMDQRSGTKSADGQVARCPATTGETVNNTIRLPSAIAVLMVMIATVLASGCERQKSTVVAASTQTYIVPKELMIHYGCPTCHVIPGVPGAVGRVGPSLYQLANRSFLAGKLPNTRANLELWISHPQQYEPGTAMPEMGITPGDARQIAAYLKTR